MFYRLRKNSEKPQRGGGNHPSPPPPFTSEGEVDKLHNFMVALMTLMGVCMGRSKLVS